MYLYVCGAARQHSLVYWVPKFAIDITDQYNFFVTLT